MTPRRPSGDSQEAIYAQRTWDKVHGGGLNLNDSPTIKWDRDSRGLTPHVKIRKGGVGTSVSIKQFKVVAEHYNYLECREWTGDSASTDSNPIVHVAKPYELRLYMQNVVNDSLPQAYTITQYGHKLVVSLVRSQDGTTFLKNARSVLYDGGGISSLIKTYYEFIDPPYLPTIDIPNPRPDGWNEDQRGFLITACKPASGVGSVGSDDAGAPIQWLDMNVSCRKWHKEIQVCDGGVARYMLVDTSEIYAGSLVPTTNNNP